MSETTGWKRCEQSGYWKVICGHRYIIRRYGEKWRAWTWIGNYLEHDTIADAKRAAHRHAEGNHNGN